MTTTQSPEKLLPGEVAVAELGLMPIVEGLAPEFPTLSKSTVWRWAQQSGAGGTGGIIPSRYHLPLLRLAKRLGRTLTAEDLVHGRAQNGE